jgi:simple sugar transport system substrate-binding protein
MKETHHVSLSARSRRWVGNWQSRSGLARLGGIATLLVGVAIAGVCATSSDASVRASSASARPLIIDVTGIQGVSVFDTSELGAEAAAKAFGVNLDYTDASLSNFEQSMVTTLQQAIGRHPAALIVGDYVPSAFDPLIKQAEAAKIPVVIANSGLSNWQSDGALSFVGASYSDIGAEAAKLALKDGAKSFVCVDDAQQNPSDLQLCNAASAVMKKAGKSYSLMYVPTADATSPSAEQTDIQGYLQSHGGADFAFAEGTTAATATIAAVKALGRTAKVKVGELDLSVNLAQDIRAGKEEFALGQGYYLQGFDAVQIADQYVTKGVVPAEPIITGPIVITRTNVAQVLKDPQLLANG